MIHLVWFTNNNRMTAHKILEALHLHKASNNSSPQPVGKTQGLLKMGQGAIYSFT